MQDAPILMRVSQYQKGNYTSESIDSIRALPAASSEEVTWIEFYGQFQRDLVEEIGQKYGLHRLAIENISTPHPRPGCEWFDECVVVSVKFHIQQGDELSSRVISLVLRKGLVLSFCHEPGEYFASVHKRLREDRGVIRKRQSDHLVYRMLQAIIENDSAIVGELEEEVEKLEQDLLGARHAVDVKQSGVLPQLYHLRIKLANFRKWTRPYREIVREIMDTEGRAIERQTQVYFRDLLHEIHWLSDSIEGLRERLNGLLDLHMSQVNNRMSEVMKVLTMISTIFIPLNLIAAVYGMNFKHMPELNWHWGYFIALGMMLSIALGMGVFFKRKKWL